MKKKLLILIPFLIVLMALAFFAGMRFYHPVIKQQSKPQVPKPYNVYEQPSTKRTVPFPDNHPQFTVEINTVKTKSLNQSSITVYQTTDDKKKTVVFKRHFYDDVFHGSTLTYSVATDTASFSQSGTLASFGCTLPVCEFPWTNFYSWDNTQKQFGIDNVNHQDFFQELLNTYQTMDQKGCAIAGDAAIPEQKGLSFTELYKKYPNLTSYCSKDTKLVTFSEFYYFLETEKIVQEIVGGKNLGSKDIKDTEI